MKSMHEKGLSLTHLRLVHQLLSDGMHRFQRPDLQDELEAPDKLLLRFLQGLAKELTVLLRDFFHCVQKQK